MSNKLVLTSIILLLPILTVVAIGCNAAGSIGGTSNNAISVTTTAAPTATPENQEPPTLIGEEGMVTYYEMTLKDGTNLQYGVVLPDSFEAGQTYPILLALPPGPQTQEMVAVGLDNYWASEASQRGWIVLSPVAPNGTLFFQGSESLIPEFLARTAAQYRPEGDKYHLAGVSNGGISAFRIALRNPELFHSVMVLPGFPYTGEEMQNLVALKDIPVAMFVGESDTSWVQRMEQTEETLTGLGGQVSLEIVPNEEHVIRSLAGGEKLFDILDSFR